MVFPDRPGDHSCVVIPVLAFRLVNRVAVDLFVSCRDLADGYFEPAGLQP